MALQDNLKAARNRMGMSQELVAERLEVSRQAVTKWEAGQSRPSARNLQALAELYQVPVEELLADTEHKKGPNLILRTNLTRIAIIVQLSFISGCTQALFQLRHPERFPDKDLYMGLFVFSLVGLTLCSTWMALNHLYEPDINQRLKNTRIELVYCLTQGFIGLLIIYAGIGLLGLALMFIVWCVYIYYINPKLMNRKFTR